MGGQQITAAGPARVPPAASTGWPCLGAQRAGDLHRGRAARPAVQHGEQMCPRGRHAPPPPPSGKSAAVCIYPDMYVRGGVGGRRAGLGALAFFCVEALPRGWRAVPHSRRYRTDHRHGREAPEDTKYRPGAPLRGSRVHGESVGGQQPCSAAPPESTSRRRAAHPPHRARMLDLQVGLSVCMYSAASRRCACMCTFIVHPSRRAGGSPARVPRQRRWRGASPSPPPRSAHGRGPTGGRGMGRAAGGWRGRLTRAVRWHPRSPAPWGNRRWGGSDACGGAPLGGGRGGGGSVHAPCWTRRLCKRGRLVTCRGRPPAEGTVTPGTTARLPVLPPGVRRWIYRQDSGSGSSVDQQPHNTRANACTPPPPACPPTVLANADPSLLPPSFRPPPSLFPHRPLVRTRPVPCQAHAPPRRWRPTRRPPAVAWLPPPSLWRS